MPTVDRDANLTANYAEAVDVSGSLTITIRPTAGVPWLVRQISSAMETAPSGAGCMLRKVGTFVTALVPTGDAAGGDPPVQLNPGDNMTVEWTDCTPGDVGTVLVFYDRLRY